MIISAQTMEKERVFESLEMELHLYICSAGNIIYS
jgi:hypothetical protein